MNPTTFDFLAIGTILCCLIISAMRGLIREVLTFFGGIIALILAYYFAVTLADKLFANTDQRMLAIIGSFILIYIVCRLCLSLLTQLLDTFIKTIKLGGINHLLGAVIGIIKGIICVSMVVLICSFTTLPKVPAWEKAITAPIFEQLASYAIPYLPDFLQQKVYLPHYHSKVIYINYNQSILDPFSFGVTKLCVAYSA